MNMDVGHTQKEDRAGGRSLTGKRVSAEKCLREREERMLKATNIHFVHA